MTHASNTPTQHRHTLGHSSAFCSPVWDVHRPCLTLLAAGRHPAFFMPTRRSPRARVLSLPCLQAARRRYAPTLVVPAHPGPIVPVVGWAPRSQQSYSSKLLYTLCLVCGGLPCAGRGGMGPLLLGPVLPRRSRRHQQAGDNKERPSTLVGTWQGQYVGEASARMPAAVSDRASGRGVQLHRCGGVAGARHASVHA